MRELRVDLAERSYSIFIGSGLLRDRSLFVDTPGHRATMIVSNETVAPLYADRLQHCLATDNTALHTLPDGEQYKTVDHWQSILTSMLERQYGRDAVLIALGGGVVGDITGFAAACFMRGIRLVQIPTTLLAMVDSSVGGKTAVNHALGKNLIGAFYQPDRVVIDIDTLSTLPPREYRAGLAEVIKYGLISDRTFFLWLEDHIDALLARDTDALLHAIDVSCRTKAKVVAEDEREQGRRALLNLGHTFGHAIEAGLGYGQWLHGEAVAAGMVLAAELSQWLGDIDTSDVGRIRQLLHSCELPVDAPTELSANDFMRIMALDKKVLDGNIRLILLDAIGHAKLRDDISHDTIKSFLQATLD